MFALQKLTSFRNVLLHGIIDEYQEPPVIRLPDEDEEYVARSGIDEDAQEGPI